jgi:hypothetical protein
VEELQADQVMAPDAQTALAHGSQLIGTTGGGGL